jgi:hypothetical protein
VRGYDRTHHIWHDKPGTLARYASLPPMPLFEDDDLIPVCLGADNASLLNHRPHLPRREWRAAKKDVLERQLCTASCLTRDGAQLARYQTAFAQDWTALRRQVFR